MGHIILKIILIGVGILAILSLGIGIFQQDGLFIVVGILLAIMTWLIYAQTRQSLNNPFSK